MERGSDKHSPRLDDALDGEVRAMVQSGHETRAEESASAEPSGEDQPDVAFSPDGSIAGGAPEGMTGNDLDERAEIAGYLLRPEKVTAHLIGGPGDWVAWPRIFDRGSFSWPGRRS